MTRPTISILLLALLLSSCSGLAGEPEIVATIPPATTIPTLAAHPAVAPDIALGAEIYAANCTSCHGINGDGDGEYALNGQIPPPASFINPATAADQTPADWYATITNGRIERLMPPWRDALSDEERWAVAMYTYTLHYTSERIQNGAALYTDRCAGCDLASLTSLDALASFSDTALTSAVSQQPAFNNLSPTQANNVAAYIRTLALANADAIGATVQAAPEAASTAEPQIGTISGTVTNGSGGGSVPAALPLTLFIFDTTLNQQQIETLATDGIFAFNDVPLDPTYAYVVTTSYRDHVFASEILSGEALAADIIDGTLDLSLTIYELTEDPDVISIAGLVTQVSVVGDSLEVAQVFNITNTGDRAFTSTQTTTDGRALSLAITLPPGAVIAGFPDNQNRYIVDAENFIFFDTVPVLPGTQHIVQVIYLIQYDTGAIIEQPLNYALDGPVRLLVRPTDIAITSDQLQRSDMVTLGSTQYQSYGAELTLFAGDVLRYDLNGAGIDPTTQGSRDAPIVTSNNLLVIIIGVIIVLALLVGALFLITSRNRAGNAQVIDILVRQIAELDADHDTGRIAADAYERQRAALKARLAALMEKEK